MSLTENVPYVILRVTSLPNIFAGNKTLFEYGYQPQVKNDNNILLNTFIKSI